MDIIIDHLFFRFTRSKVDISLELQVAWNGIDVSLIQVASYGTNFGTESDHGLVT